MVRDKVRVRVYVLRFTLYVLRFIPTALCVMPVFTDLVTKNAEETTGECTKVRLLQRVNGESNERCP